MRQNMIVRCYAKDCNREFDAPEGHEHYFCSIECACYAGYYNVRTGWKVPDKKDEDETEDK